MKGLHLLTIGDFVFIFNHLADARRRELLQPQPLLQGWVPRLDAMFAELARLPQGIDGPDAHPTDGEVATKEGAETLLQRRDRVIEACIRTLRQGVSAGREQALGREDAADAERWQAADAALFPEGLVFLKRSLPEQVGETIRLLERLNDGGVAWLPSRFNLHGQTLAETVDAIQRNNKALNDALTADAPAAQAVVSLVAMRRSAQALLKSFLGVVDVAFPPKDLAHTDARAALLSPLHARIAFRVAKQAAEKRREAKKNEATEATEDAAAATNPPAATHPTTQTSDTP